MTQATRGRVAPWVLAGTLLCALLADAQGRRPRKPLPLPPAPVLRREEGKERPRVKVMDFTGLGILGTLRTPQLLYFLQRVKTELDRASLEARSFLPELTRSIGEEGL